MHSGGSTALTDFFGVIVSPSISQRNCCGVKERTSSGFRGHWKLLSDSLLCSRSQPSPSHTSPLWNCIDLFQNYPFHIISGLPFTYNLKTGRYGGAVEGEKIKLVAMCQKLW